MARDYPRPNLNELPELYAELDELVDRAEKAIRALPARFFEKENEVIRFESMTRTEFEELVARDPGAMVIAFTRVCGLSDREFSRLFKLDSVYRLRESWQNDEASRTIFTNAITGLLPKRMYVETFLFTFYKMWEEHQKRHYRARFEEDVRAFFRSKGYECAKITAPTEINGAIPPHDPQVAMQVRTGVRKDLVKRVKEFSSEFDRCIEAFPKAKFMVIFKIPDHELRRREEIRQTIAAERKGKRPYDAVLFHDELEKAIDMLRNWNVRAPLKIVSSDTSDHR